MIGKKYLRMNYLNNLTNRELSPKMTILLKIIKKLLKKFILQPINLNKII
jgi:hypothetical protein